MTMRLKIEHIQGPDFAARIKIDGKPDQVVMYGETVEIDLNSSQSASIVEEPAPKANGEDQAAS